MVMVEVSFQLFLNWNCCSSQSAPVAGLYKMAPLYTVQYRTVPLRECSLCLELGFKGSFVEQMLRSLGRKYIILVGHRKIRGGCEISWTNVVLVMKY